VRGRVLLFWLPFFGLSLAAAKPVAVPLDVRTGHPSIELTLNGKGPYRFLVDTGSGADLIVDAELATELGLKSTGSRRIGDPNSPEAIEARVVKIGRVQLGGLTLRNVEAISWKRDVLGMAEFPRGVVGLGLFGPRLVTLDAGQGQLIVEEGALPAADGGIVLTASFEDGIPSLPIDVAGVPYRAHLDSGSTAFVGLPLAAAEELPLESPPVQVGRARTASGDYQVTESRLKGSIRVGGIAIDNPKVRFVDLPQANLGFDLLRSLIVTVDRKNARVRLVANGKPLEPSERPRFGVVTHGVLDGQLPIERVAPGSPAEAAGLKAGDRIVRVNGHAVTELTPSALGLAFQGRPLSIAYERDGAEAEVKIAPTPP